MAIERRDGAYRVRIFHRGRYVRSGTFRTKREAEAFQREQYSALASGTWVAVSAVSTVEDHARRWLEMKHGGKPSSVADRKTSIERHVLPVFGRLPMSSVAPSEVERWALRLATVKSPSTARKALGALRSVFDLAVRDGLMARNPASGIKLPTAQPNEPRPLTHQQLRALINHASTDRDRLMVAVAGYTGLRWGELSALRVASVRGDGSIRVTQAWSEVAGTLHLGTTKTHAARTVTPPPSVGRDLLQYIEAKNTEDLLFPSFTSPRVPLRNRNWTLRTLQKLCEVTAVPRITPHNLRDTAASLAIQAGASVVNVSQMLGHRDAATTLKHYATFFPTDSARIADQLEERIQSLAIDADQTDY